MELVRENTLVNEFVIVDGQGRSGKGMIGHILSSMERVELWRVDPLFDNVPIYYSLGKMSRDAAIASLKIEADEKLYNTLIGRNVNLRWHDTSSIFKNGRSPIIYLKRLLSKSDPDIAKLVKEEKPIFQNLTHDSLGQINIFFEAFEKKLKFIHIIRDPVENIYELCKRNFGTRIGLDPIEFQLTYKWKGKFLPLCAHGWEEDYLKANPTERIIGMVNHFFHKNLNEYKKLDKKWKKQTLFIEFEKFVIDPIPHCKKLENFIGTKMTPRTKHVLKKERCPRILDLELREEKIRNIEKKSSPKYKKMFRNLINDFDTKIWEKI